MTLERRTSRIGNCRILGEIGSGGMATIYEAIQEPLERKVAIKALKPSIAFDSQFADRFEREAHFMASLQHENILHVIDFVKKDTSMYIVLEHVEGVDLRALLNPASPSTAKPTQTQTVLPVEVAMIVALQVARALDYAHFRGVIHRDIKPANMMLSKTGSVKLMDFGIAHDDRLSDLTETGTSLGTPSYMSPEQILGDRLDARSDIFSLGIVLYEMTAGEKPFVEDGTRTVMQKIRLDRYVSPRKFNTKIPRAVERIIGRCLEKIPANRYPTMQALIDDMMEFLAPRVPMNYSARLVLYLRDAGVIEETEAAQILEPGIPMPHAHEQRRDRTLLRDVFWMHAAVCAVVLGAGVGVQAWAGTLTHVSLDAPPTVESATLPDNAGGLRVVVDPWADVYLDGKKVLTTPSNREIPLAPGRYYLRFVNPYYHEERREVTIEPSRTKRIEMALVPLHAVNADNTNNTADEEETEASQ